MIKWMVGMSVGSDISVTRLSWNPGVRIVTEISRHSEEKEKLKGFEEHLGRNINRI